MRSVLLGVRANLEEFVQQPEHSLLLVCSTDNDVAYVLKILEQVQGEDTGSVYFSFADEFDDEASYARRIAQRLIDLFALANEERAKDGVEPLAPFPDGMLAPNTPPRERVLIGLEHVSTYLPNTEEHRVVLALTPLAIPPGGGYFRFLTQFAQLRGVEPWMRYVRIIGRDDRNRTAMTALRQIRAEGALGFDADFSTDALAAAMASEAVDPALPVADRMQAVLQLAMIDMSWKRYGEAVQKYGILYDYYQRSEAPIMQALCLLGVGDCLRMAGSLAEAKTRYQQGLALVTQVRAPFPVPAPNIAPGVANPNEGMHPNAPPVMLNLLLAVGETSMSLSQFEDARSYFESASKVCAKCMNPFAAADALVRMGDAELALRKPAEALKAWRDSEKIAESVKYWDGLEHVLERIERLYREAAMRAEQRAATDKLEGVRLLRRKGTA